jgi:hypothetical protein
MESKMTQVDHINARNNNWLRWNGFSRGILLDGWLPMGGNQATAVDALRFLSRDHSDSLTRADIATMLLYCFYGAWYAHDGMDDNAELYSSLPDGVRYPTEQELDIIFS